MRLRRWQGPIAAVAIAGIPGGVSAGPPDPPLPPRRPPALVVLPPALVPAEASAIPLPPPRPGGLGLPQRAVFGPPMPPRPLPPTAAVPPAPPPATITASPAEPAPTPGAPVPAEDELACARLFSSGKVEARALAPLGGTGGCGIAAPIALSAIVLSPARRIPVEPPVTIDCALGDRLADWVRIDLAPAFDMTHAPLAALTGTSGYACRGRNNVAGAKLSEHGKGRAVDIGGFRTADGRTIGVRQTGAAVLATIRATACARFATVLGPGSDGFHESHMHVDIEQRRHGTVLCEWTLP